MRNHFRHCLLAAALAVSAPALAHDTDGACALEGAQMVAVGSFDFSAEDLAAFALSQQSGGGKPVPGGGDMCTPTSCGIVDDHWSMATKRAFQYCESQWPGSVAQVTAPASYTNELLHHSLYSFAPGTPNLQGLCVRCTTRVRLPAGR
jgi:hypothetical protein